MEDEMGELTLWDRFLNNWRLWALSASALLCVSGWIAFTVKPAPDPGVPTVAGAEKTGLCINALGDFEPCACITACSSTMCRPVTDRPLTTDRDCVVPCSEISEAVAVDVPVPTTAIDGSDGDAEAPEKEIAGPGETQP
jgi:hypothetical protein